MLQVKSTAAQGIWLFCSPSVLNVPSQVSFWLSTPPKPFLLLQHLKAFYVSMSLTSSSSISFCPTFICFALELPTLVLFPTAFTSTSTSSSCCLMIHFFLFHSTCDTHDLHFSTSIIWCWHTPDSCSSSSWFLQASPYQRQDRKDNIAYSFHGA